VEANLEQRETELSLREEALQGLQAGADRIRSAVQVTANQRPPPVVSSASAVLCSHCWSHSGPAGSTMVLALQIPVLRMLVMV
jgi:hypothetical protein